MPFGAGRGLVFNTTVDMHSEAQKIHARYGTPHATMNASINPHTLTLYLVPTLRVGTEFAPLRGSPLKRKRFSGFL